MFSRIYKISLIIILGSLRLKKRSAYIQLSKYICFPKRFAVSTSNPWWKEQWRIWWSLQLGEEKSDLTKLQGTTHPRENPPNHKHTNITPHPSTPTSTLDDWLVFRLLGSPPNICIMIMHLHNHNDNPTVIRLLTRRSRYCGSASVYIPAYTSCKDIKTDLHTRKNVTRSCQHCRATRRNNWPDLIQKIYWNSPFLSKEKFKGDSIEDPTIIRKILRYTWRVNLGLFETK